MARRYRASLRRSCSFIADKLTEDTLEPIRLPNEMLAAAGEYNCPIRFDTCIYALSSRRARKCSRFDIDVKDAGVDADEEKVESILLFFSTTTPLPLPLLCTALPSMSAFNDGLLPPVAATATLLSFYNY